jgi:uncharacterized membrane protein YeaQ/YmgE (transglycosylase-associated protein family)
VYRQLFTYPVAVATGLLVVHSWLYRGRRNTMLFWGLGYFVAFARELAYQNLFPTYRFTGSDLRLFGVPLTIPAGWLFEAYISLYLAQFILGVDHDTIAGGEERMTPHRYGERVLPVLCLGTVVTSTIAFAIESVAVPMRWWQPRGSGAYMSPGWIPGHMFTVFWLLTLLLYVTHPALRLRRNLAYVALALAFTAVVELIDVIKPAAQSHTWLWAVVALPVAGYLACLFMWPRLVLFFFVVFVLGVMGDIPAGLLASFFGITQQSGVMPFWLGWVVCVMLAYGLLIFGTQRPARPARPARLL